MKTNEGIWKAILLYFLLIVHLVASKTINRDGKQSATNHNNKGQAIDTKQIIEIGCSECDKRISSKPPPLCCRCIDGGATCNNEIASGGNGNGNRQKSKDQVSAGLTCPLDIECQLYGVSCNKPGCSVQGVNIIDEDRTGFDLKQGGVAESCGFGLKVCCNAVDSDYFITRLGLVSERNPLGEPVDTEAVCEDSKLRAVQDFGHGVTCGKRDSRTYYAVNAGKSFTSPGEWPWVVLIFSNGKYIGAGTLMANDVVVTVAHKVKNYVTNPHGLVVRLGDWNPYLNDKAEEYPHIEKSVRCVRLHPDADLDGTLANNVAVLKLDSRDERIRTPREKNVASVIDLKTGPSRAADNPEGVPGFSKIDRESFLDLKLGLVSVDDGQDPLGDPTAGLPEEISPSYINTVCLPQNEAQFKDHGEDCWVAAWGNDLTRQREVNLPLVSNPKCESILRPIFEERNVSDWRLQPSELCAGGVPGVDTCQGEGGSPLVCYDRGSDQFFALGLTNYGFGCNNTRPSVYTNLADPSVKEFITRSFDNDYDC